VRSIPAEKLALEGTPPADTVVEMSREGDTFSSSLVGRLQGSNQPQRGHCRSGSLGILDLDYGDNMHTSASLLMPPLLMSLDIVCILNHVAHRQDKWISNMDAVALNVAELLFFVLVVRPACGGQEKWAYVARYTYKALHVHRGYKLSPTTTIEVKPKEVPGHRVLVGAQGVGSSYNRPIAEWIMDWG
jgi:hypothetical protein